MHYLRLKWEELREERKVARAFYHHGFSAVDRALKRAYLWENPYRICKHFLLRRGETDLHQYGETPLTTFHEIALFSDLKSSDHLFELGCGRGRGAFFLHHIFGCQVTAIDWVPPFILRAKRIARHFGLDKPGGINFLCEDYRAISLKEASVIYLYGTCLPDNTIYELCRGITHPVRVVSVSYPLSDYDKRFILVKKSSFSYPWGKAEVYLNELRL